MVVRSMVMNTASAMLSGVADKGVQGESNLRGGKI